MDSDIPNKYRHMFVIAETDGLTLLLSTEKSIINYLMYTVAVRPSVIIPKAFA